MSKYVIEADDKRNGLITFLPAKKKLRGRASIYNLVPLTFHSENLLAKMPEIPGQRIVLDSEARTGKIVDPLNDPSTAKLREEITRVHKTLPGAPTGDYKVIGVQDSSYSLKQEIDWNTWVWHCHQLVSSGLAEVVEGGALPHIKGKIKCNESDYTEKAVKERVVDTEAEELESALEAEEKELEALA